MPLPPFALRRLVLPLIGLPLLAIAMWTALGLGSLIELPWHEWPAALVAAVQAQPLRMGILILVLHALVAALALPGAAPLMFVAGAGFGVVTGTLICLAGCTAGATLMMLAARQWLRPWLTRRHAHRLAGLDARLAREGASLLFALRMLPVLPFSLTNIAAGMAGMKAWPFFRVSFAGMLIGTVVYVNAGAQMASIDSVDALVSPRIVASLAAIAVVPWLAGHLARRMGWSAATSAKEA